MAVKIITDGSADMPQQWFEDWGIVQIPLTVSIDDEHFSSDLDKKVFYQKMRDASKLPSTASPSPHTFIEAFKKAREDEDILVITLTSALSSTYNNALIAQQMHAPEHKGTIEVIDSRTASCALGLLVHRAAQLAKDGLHINQIVEHLRGSIANIRTHVFLETLENVIKGGRLDKVRGSIASVLNVKLLLRTTEEGSLEVMDKVRGSQNAIKKLIDKISEVSIDFDKGLLAIAHSNCEEKAKEIMAMIKSRYPFKQAFIAEMGPVIGTYAGEGGIVLSYE